MLKFDVGTSGTEKTYFQVKITESLSIEMSGVANYKSGVKTGCGEMCFPGFGCPEPEDDDSADCSFSQGYWFAKPDVVWPYDVEIGGHTYTQAECKAIWATSNKGGISDAKKVFCQIAAIKLSGSTVSSTAIVWLMWTFQKTGCLHYQSYQLMEPEAHLQCNQNLPGIQIQLQAPQQAISAIGLRVTIVIKSQFSDLIK